MSKKTPLETYFEILRSERDARYLTTMEIHLDFDDDATLDALWKIHDDAILGKSVGGGEKNLLDLKVMIADRMLNSCHLCERRCGVDRVNDEVGYCGVDAVSRIKSEFLHMGEEEELVPSHTIFFTGCTFSCVYCQNWDIATAPQSGVPVVPEILSEVILMRNIEGSRNVNFVGGDPTPHIPIILKILNRCSINTPIIFNSNMYLSHEAMKLLDGVVDLYLGDFRYGNDRCAKKYSDVDNYREVVTRNFLFAEKNSEVLMRHLVLPDHLECCNQPIMEWTAKNMEKIRFNLLFQYHPCHRANLYPEIDRKLTKEEMASASELRDRLLRDP